MGRWVRIVLVAVLMVAGLAVAPAQAASVALSGKVAYPSGYTGDRPLLTVTAALPDEPWSPVATADVAADGTYRLDGLDAQTSYLVSIEAGFMLHADVYGGYVVDAAGRLGPQAKAIAIRPRTGQALVLNAAVTLTGRVVVPPGVTTTLSAMDVQVYSRSPGTGIVARLDSTGAFVVNRLDPSEQYTAELEDFSYEGMILRGYYAGDSTVGLVDRFSAVYVPGGSSITMHPAKAAAISGTVELPDGYEGDVTAIRVVAEATAYAPYGSSGSGNVRADGSFRVGGLRADRSFNVSLTDESHAVLGGELTDVSTGELGDDAAPVSVPLTGLTLRPRISAHLVVEVPMPTGVTVDGSDLSVVLRTRAGARVDAVSRSAQGWSFVDLQADERYTVCLTDRSQVLAPGCYGGVDAGALVPEDRAERVAPSGTVRLTPVAAVTMSGTLSLPAGKEYDPYDCDVVAHAWNASTKTWSYETCGTVLSDGSFTVGGLDPDTEYQLSVDGRGFVGGYLVDADGGTGLRSKAISFTPHSGVVVVMRSAVELSGDVALPTDTGGLEVTVRDEDGDVVADRAVRDLQFDVRGLDPHLSYSIELTDRYGGVVGGFYAGDTTEGLVGRDAALRVTPPAHVTMHPEERAALWGQVSVPSEWYGSLAGVTVHAWAWNRETGAWVERGSSRVDDDKNFVIKDLRPGIDYRVQVTDSSGLYVEGWLTDDLGAVGAQSDAVAAEAGAFRFVTLKVVPERTVRAVVAPVTSGRWTTGSVVSVSAGTWSTPGLTFEYVWYRDEERLDDPQSARHTLTAEDVGARMSVLVRAGKEGFVPAYFYLTGPVVAPGTLSPSSAPKVSGTTSVGSTLQASSVSWSPVKVSTSYRWFRDGSPISGATASRYVVTPADLGKRLTVRVTASAPGYTSASTTSASTSAITPGRFVVKSAPRVSGTAVVGSRLTASTGTWSPSKVTVTYRWLRDGVSISGATSATHLVTSADVGSRLAVRVTAHATGYVAASSTSSSAMAHRSKPTVKVALSRTTARASDRVRVTVIVSAPGVKHPAGKVVVTYGHRHHTATLTSRKAGKATYTLPALAKGRYSVSASFVPTGSTARATTSAHSHSVSLRVR